MEILTLIIIAFGLSFDTFAVSVSNGLILKKITFSEATRIAIVFAVFQALMPVLGWLIGLNFKDLIQDYDHWVAFIILGLLGIKMIMESFKKEEDKAPLNPLSSKVMVSMAIATSIDALVVGFSFALLNFQIILSTILIGSITYIVAMLGMLFGKKIGERAGKRMEIIGGLMLIAIGSKILFEHLVG